MYHFCITINFYVFQEGRSLYCFLAPGQILSWSQPRRLRCLQPRYSNLPKRRGLAFVLTLPLSERHTGSGGDVSKAWRTWLTNPWLQGKQRKLMQHAFKNPSRSPYYLKVQRAGEAKSRGGADPAAAAGAEQTSLISKTELR